jgi:hypothetical protein
MGPLESRVYRRTWGTAGLFALVLGLLSLPVWKLPHAVSQLVSERTGPRHWDAGVWRERRSVVNTDCLVYGIRSGNEKYSKWAFNYYSDQSCSANFAESNGLRYRGSLASPYWLKVLRAFALKRYGTTLLYVDSDVRLNVSKVLALEDPYAIVFPELNSTERRKGQGAAAYETMAFLVGKFVSDVDFSFLMERWLVSAIYGRDQQGQDLGAIRTLVREHGPGCSVASDYESWGIGHCDPNFGQSPRLRAECLIKLFGIRQWPGAPYMRSRDGVVITSGENTAI